MSQASVASSVCSIPQSIIYEDDEEFIEELTRVNDLFFGNVEVHENVIEETSVETSESDDENHEINNNNDCEIELTASDEQENDSVSKFFENTCKCIRLYGKPCSSNVCKDVLIEYRRNCLETPKTELDILIKVQLFHHRNNSTETESKKHKSKAREKVRQKYYFSGIQVCRETFAFAHAVSRKTIDSIARSLDQDGLIARVHGNKGKSPKHALTLGDVQKIKQFLLNYGNKFGLPLPGRLPNFRNEKTVLLPSDKTKAEIHQDYLKVAEELQYRKICLSEFKSIWLEQCPHILIMKPATDLCHTCQSFSTSL